MYVFQTFRYLLLNGFGVWAIGEGFTTGNDRLIHIMISVHLINDTTDLIEDRIISQNCKQAFDYNCYNTIIIKL